MLTTSTSSLYQQEELLPWRMPFEPSDYSDRHFALTDEERKRIKRLIALSSGQYREFERQVEQMKRLTQPLFDVMAFFQQRRPTSRIAKQHFVGYFLGHVLQTNMLYWDWPENTWKEVIDAVPTRPKDIKRRRERRCTTCHSPNFLLTNLAAYLFAGVLHLQGKGKFPYRALGELVFGTESVQVAIDRLKVPWLATGYTSEQQSQEDFVHAVILALLVNRSPFPEALTHSSLEALRTFDFKREARDRIGQLQNALVSLQILSPDTQEAKRHQPTPRIFQDDFVVGIHPHWIAWLRAFWLQTPISPNNRSAIVNGMTIACRWLAERYPHVTEPDQWAGELAFQYVAYVCNEATIYDYASPVTKQELAKYLSQRQGEPLKAAGMKERIATVKKFFRCLQKYSYEIDGQTMPRLAINWNPTDNLAVPEHVVAQLQPNPRNVEEEAWLKLVWTACTLNADMIKEVLAGPSKYPLSLWRAVALVWVTGCRRRDEIRRLPLECIRSEWAPEMIDENGVQLEPAEHLWYLRVPTNKYRGDFWTPIPQYTAEAILAWKAIRPRNQALIEDRRTGKPTEYLFQYRGKMIGENFINDYLIPRLCKIAGLTDEDGEPYRDAVGPITSHRARSSTAYYLKAMGMTPYDIGKLLGHTNPNKTLPWYLKENLHQLGRMYRKANPLDRTVQALLDTNAAAKGEPCVFYYLADSPEGRPRLCGNPNFRTCYHQLQCAECGAYIDTEMAEVIERRPGCLQTAVSIPLPKQLVEDLSKQEEGMIIGEPPLPPSIPSAAFHFNKKSIAHIEEPCTQAVSELEQLQARMRELETQLAAKGKQDARNVSIRLLKQEINGFKKRITQVPQEDETNG